MHIPENAAVISRVLWSIEDLADLMPFTYAAAYGRLGPLQDNAPWLVAHAQLLMPEQYVISRMTNSVVRAVERQLTVRPIPDDCIARAAFGQLSPGEMHQVALARIASALAEIIYGGQPHALYRLPDAADIDTAFTAGAYKLPWDSDGLFRDNPALEQVRGIFCRHHSHPWWYACKDCGS